MKLNSQLLSIVAVVYLALIASPWLLAPYSLITFIILCIGAALIVSAALYTLVIKPLKKLNKQINQELIHPSASKLDEITRADLYREEMSKQINEFHHTIKYLKKNNKRLEQIISQHTLVERELERERECLSSISKQDALTALPNRIFFNEMLNKAMSHVKRRNKILAVLLVHLDFKTSNQETTEWHDTALKEMAQRFQKILRSEDVIAKLENHEFIILLSDLSKSKFASIVAEKLLAACEEPVVIDDNKVFVTADIGIAIYPNDGESLEDLLKSVDSALYHAKQAGQHAYHFYAKEMNAEAREYIQLESALRNAIHNHHLTLYYQPKFSMKKGNIVGVETLLRWEHPALGIINPETFISLAEETGLIFQIGEWVLFKACELNKKWQDEGYEHITVSVNLSPKQFYHPDIATIITNILDKTGLNPHYLELEITEKTIMDDVKLTGDILQKLKATGVQLSIDHFGVGYTAISYLKEFPINQLKLDKSFIKGIPNSSNDMAITNALIGLAHSLGLEVVAEGVETAEQVQYLSNQHCDVVQGYFLSHPLPAHTVVLQLSKLSDKTLV